LGTSSNRNAESNRRRGIIGGMVDERTKEYLKQLQKTIDAAGEICKCANCARERMQKEITQCDKNRLLEYLPEEMMGGPLPGDVIPQLSPNYELWNSGKRRSF
jgi:hypothetical protein